MASSKKPKQPEPVSVDVVCSQCGLNWGLHGKNPTLEDCVRLLKAEVQRLKLCPPVPYVERPFKIVPEKAPPWVGREPYTITYNPNVNELTQPLPLTLSS